MLIRNSDTGQMMELDLATGDMKPLSDGPPQTPTGDTGSPGKAPDSPDDFVDSSPEKGGRKRPFPVVTPMSFGTGGSSPARKRHRRGEKAAEESAEPAA